MATSIGLVTETFTEAEDITWLRTVLGREEMQSITLDGAAFATTYPTGKVPSGTALGKITATGRYGPYDNAAVDGRGTAMFLLGTTAELKNKANVFVNASAPGQWLGDVIIAKLPAVIDAPGQADLKSIRFS